MIIKKGILSALVLSFTIGCTGTIPFLNQATPTPTQPPPPTSTPQPTPTPTPLPTPTPQPAERIFIGDRFLHTGEFELAQQEYQTAATTGTDQETLITARIGMGRLYMAQGEYASALDIFRGVIEEFPGLPVTGWAYFHYGEALFDLQRYQEAADAYGSYLALRPGFLDAYVREIRGNALSAAGDYASAESAYRDALQAPQLTSTDDLTVKISRMQTNQANYQGAIQTLADLYATTSSDYTRALVDLLMGQNYLAMDDLENANAAFYDAVNHYPRSIDTYYALVSLVDAGVPVDEYNRGLVDYYAGQFTPAIDAFDRFMATAPDHDGTALYYKGLALQALGDHEGAIAAWRSLIEGYPANSFWTDAWEEIGFDQWYYLEAYGDAAQTYVDFVSAAPDDAKAPDALFQAARNLERADRLEEAAVTWERIADEYTTSELTFQSLFLAGICRYRQSNWAGARTSLQRGLVLTTGLEDQAAAYLWIGKTYQQEGNLASAQSSWQLASQIDPTGYYSERASELLSGQPLFPNIEKYDLAYDLEAERVEAESWLRTTFNIPPDTNLADLGDLRGDARLVRGQEYWSLGLWEEARNEFEALREAVSADPVQTFVLIRYFYQVGVYRSAIFASRQVLSLAGMDDAATLTAPIYFNHIRFGTYYKDLVFQEAQDNGLSPLFLLSVIRQESLFEGFVQSSAGARGLMQIMPATGQGEADSLGWPEGFTPDDLYLPSVSLRLGSHYMARQISYFNGDMYAALAAYNGGPGNAMAWQELASGDPDLFLEVVRIEETRNYIRGIYELFTIYRRIYEQIPG